MIAMYYCDIYLEHLSGGTEENHKNLSQNSWFPGQNLNLRPSELEAGVLTITL